MNNTNTNPSINLTELDIKRLIIRWCSDGWSLRFFCQVARNNGVDKIVFNYPDVESELKLRGTFPYPYQQPIIYTIFEEIVACAEVSTRLPETHVLYESPNWWDNFAHGYRKILSWNYKHASERVSKCEYQVSTVSQDRFPKKLGFDEDYIEYIKENKKDWLEDREKGVIFLKKLANSAMNAMNTFESIQRQPEAHARSVRIGSYNDYLQSGNWKTVRLAALHRANYRCQLCNGTERLEVHHRTYERLGEERETDLLVLDRDCHSAFHANGKLKKG